MTKKKRNGKKDPEAPYYERPTPGHPGWNLAGKGKKGGKGGPPSVVAT